MYIKDIQHLFIPFFPLDQTGFGRWYDGNKMIHKEFEANANLPIFDGLMIAAYEVLQQAAKLTGLSSEWESYSKAEKVYQKMYLSKYAFVYREHRKEVREIEKEALYVSSSRHRKECTERIRVSQEKHDTKKAKLYKEYCEADKPHRHVLITSIIKCLEDIVDQGKE